MSVKIKKADLVPVVNALGALCKPDSGIPAAAGWTCGRMLRELAPKARKFEEEKNDLIRRFGEKQRPKVKDGETMPPEDQWNIVVSPDSGKWEEYRPLAESLFAEEVECPYTIKVSAFGDAPVGGLVAALGDLVVE